MLVVIKFSEQILIHATTNIAIFQHLHALVLIGNDLTQLINNA